MKITLNLESAAVLIRCLAYGQSSITQAEAQSGVGQKIESNCEMLRKQVARQMAEQILKAGFIRLESAPLARKE